MRTGSAVFLRAHKPRSGNVCNRERMEERGENDDARAFVTAVHKRVRGARAERQQRKEACVRRWDLELFRRLNERVAASEDCVVGEDLFTRCKIWTARDKVGFKRTGSEGVDCMFDFESMQEHKDAMSELGALAWKKYGISSVIAGGHRWGCDGYWYGASIEVVVNPPEESPRYHMVLD